MFETSERFRGLTSVYRWFRILLLFALCNSKAASSVVINEIMYHAPADLEDLQWVELHNPGKEEVSLEGWSFSRGIEFDFKSKNVLPPGGFLVIAKDQALFKKFYRADVLGPFRGTLKRKGERLELRDSKSNLVDSVRYKDQFPWAVGPDGFSSSLERMSSSSPGNLPDNWSGSTLSKNPDLPGGTPGVVNSQSQPAMPPVIAKVKVSRTATGIPQQIDVELESKPELKRAEVFLQSVGNRRSDPPAKITLNSTTPRVWSAVLPTNLSGPILRLWVEIQDRSGSVRRYPGITEPRPTLSYYINSATNKDVRPGIAQFLLFRTDPNFRPLRGNSQAPRYNGRPPESAPPVQGQAALVVTTIPGADVEVFDYISFHERPAGYKVHLHRDQPWHEMTSLNLIYEANERFTLAEPLAYEVFRRAGVPASRTEFVRVTLDNQALGVHLLIEQPNKAFLRHRNIDDRGNLYKLLWYEDGLVGQHEKKTRLYSGHFDLETVVKELGTTGGAAQWNTIKHYFNVEEVMTFFAVSSLISSWDGFFNNYFAYHDLERTLRWEIYPWDLDKTFGFFDGIGPNEKLIDMPLSFGAENDRPPGWTRSRAPRHFMEGGVGWWRPGGWFSKPILANAPFREQYHARIKQLLETEFTDAKMEASLNALVEKLKPEVAYRAELRGEPSGRALKRLDRNALSIRENFTQRRAWLLAQPEIQKASAFDRTLLK